AAVAASFQSLGWFCQLLAVWAAMRAFEIHQPITVAAVVLVLMNVATIFPLWPGNVGLLQAAIALPLRSYGVAYGKGFAFGIGLQAIEASVGVGIGGEPREATVSDPLGRPVVARWVVRADGTAVVDSAAALGLPLLSADELDPLRASSAGLGELLLAVLAERPPTVIVGVGGT